LRPLEADDAGIFFGREAPVIEAIDRVRGLAQATPPRLMVILGASGAGKSSFLRAGLLPRLGRDPLTFLPLPVIRPERAAINGETGLVSALAEAFNATSLKVGLDGTVIQIGDAHVGPVDVTSLDVHGDAVGEVAIGDDGLAVGAVGIH
jgi:hypothetical protein